MFMVYFNSKVSFASQFDNDLHLNIHSIWFKILARVNLYQGVHTMSDRASGQGTLLVPGCSGRPHYVQWCVHIHYEAWQMVRLIFIFTHCKQIYFLSFECNELNGNIYCWYCACIGGGAGSALRDWGMQDKIGIIWFTGDKGIHDSL